MDFVGPVLPSDVATAVADGDMDPITMKRFPAHVPSPSQCSLFQPSSGISKIEVARKVRTSLPEPKAETTSTAAVLNAARSSSIVVTGNPSSSLMDERVSTASLHKEPFLQNSLTDKIVATSPLLESRFFGENVEKMSLSDELVKKALPRWIDFSYYQSQKQCEV